MDLDLSTFPDCTHEWIILNLNATPPEWWTDGQRNSYTYTLHLYCKWCRATEVHRAVCEDVLVDTQQHGTA